MKKKTERLNPTPENPNLFYCHTEGKLRFSDQRETCFTMEHKTVPIVGKLFTETDEYFEGIEMDAFEHGEISL